MAEPAGVNRPNKRRHSASTTDAVTPPPSSVSLTATQLLHKLQTDPVFGATYGKTTGDVVRVLDLWNDQFARHAGMSSFFRTESRLLHETEECIVALHHFQAWWRKRIV